MILRSLPRPGRLAVPILLLLTAWPAAAQERGSVSGKVSDRKTGHALPFATVTVVEAKSGGLSDSEGQFVIGGLAPGTYEIRVQFLGYRQASQTAVVTGGKVTVVNFQLEEVVVRTEKQVVVTAERRLVEVRQGTTIRSVDAGEIRNLPVQTLSEVLQHQAGINTENDQIHVRGGRTDETIFVVNGVANRDLVTGASTAGQLNARSIAEVNVATGAYDVRYGNALSGVVEVKLKEGGDRLSGGVTASTGTYGNRRVQVVVGGPDPVIGRLLRLAGAPGTFSSIVDLSGSMAETRFLSPTHSNWVSSLFQNAFEPAERKRLRSSYEDSFLGHRFRYGDAFTPASDNRWSGRYALTWRPNGRDKVSANFLKRIAIDQGFGRSFINAAGDLGDPAFPWRWARRLDHASTIFEDNVQSSIEWRRTLSTTGYTTLHLSRYFFAQRQDVQGKMWPEYEQPDDHGAFPGNDPRSSDFFIDSGDDNTWQDRRTTTYALQWSLTQRFKRHEIEVGLDHESQSVQYATIEDPWVFDPDGLGGAHDLWRVHPWVGDLYIRDRLEYEGFTANIGLRADYWFVGREAERAVADTSNPNVSAATREAFRRDTRSVFGRRAKIHVSPRVIVAHPITENSSFFFNYGQFRQNPAGRYVYSKLTSISSEAFPLLGNPNLNPQTSVNYEVGAKHQFLPTAAVNATFFVKDIYDYPTATVFRRSQGQELVDIFVYLNGHFARSKGFEIEVEKRRSNYWSGKLTYTRQETKGKSSDPFQQKVVEEAGGDAAETRLSETFVRWNRPHKLAASFDVRFDDEAPWSWLRRSGLNVYVQGQSGRAYTPHEVVGTTLFQAGEENSANGLFQVVTDVRLNHWIEVGGRRLDLGLSGTNIFNNYVIQRVDRVGGRGRVWGDGEYDPAVLPRLTSDTRSALVDDVSNYSAGAQWRLTLDYDF